MMRRARIGEYWGVRLHWLIGVVFASMALCSGQVRAAAVSWIAGDGDWNAAVNWSSDPALPGPADDVTIDRSSGPITVTHASATHDILSLQSAENLVISGGTLRVGSGGGSIEGNLSLTTPSASLVSRTGMLTVNGALQLSAGILRAQSGGHLLFPSLTTFTATNSGGRFEAEGSGSKIDLANLTGFSGGTGIGTVVSASGGALVDIPQISSITVGATTFDAIGAGSTIDLSGLTNFSADNFASNRRLRAEQGARIISPNLATLGRVRVELGGTTSSIDLGKVTKVDEATLQAFAGGQMAIPMTTTIAGTTSGSSLLSDGTGSLLDLNSITSYSGGTALGSVIRASAGGHLEMKNVTSIMTGATSIESSGVGSVIDLNNLVEIDADNFASNRRLRAVDGGQILTPNLTTLGRIQLEVIGPTSSIDTADIITVNQTSLLASGGGTVELPLVTSIVHEANSVTIQADGAGSLMDLTSVTTFAGATVAGTSVQATLGGRVDLSNVVSITAGATSVTANGPGSVVDLAKLQEFAADNLASTRLLRAANGGQILTPALTTIGRVRIELDGPTSSIDLTSTTDIDEASLFARGGASLEPSAVTSMVHGSSGATVEADGVGSLVDLSGITALSGGTVVGTTVRAFNGGRVDLTGITSITAGAIDFVSSGAESVLDISNVTEYAATNMASSRRIRGEGGGTVMLRPAGTVELTNVQMSVTSDGSITGDTVALNDGTLLTGTGTIQTSIVNRAGDIRPGDAVGETSIGGDLTQESAGRIIVQFQTSPAGVSYDTVKVGGHLQLGGTLEASIPGDVPLAFGDRFEVIQAGSGVAGTFDRGILPSPGPKLQWFDDVAGNVAALEIGLAGDYNRNNVVDAADFTVWKDNFGGGKISADGNGNGIVDAADFTVWKDNFGNTPASLGTPLAQAVPEPSLGATLAGLIIACRRRRPKPMLHGCPQPYS